MQGQCPLSTLIECNPQGCSTHATIAGESLINKMQFWYQLCINEIDDFREIVLKSAFVIHSYLYQIL